MIYDCNQEIHVFNIDLHVRVFFSANEKNRLQAEAFRVPFLFLVSSETQKSAK